MSFEKRTGFTRAQLCTAALLATMVKCTGKENVMLTSIFHNRVDPATQNALGFVCRKIPVGVRFGNMQNAAELLSDVKKQTIESARYCACEYVNRYDQPLYDDFIHIVYETADITNSRVSEAIQMTPYPIETDMTRATIEMFYQIFESGGTVTSLLAYSNRFFSESRVQYIAKKLAQITRTLLDAENPEALSLDALIHA